MAVLTGIPPWIHPPDFIGAAKSGAALGLQGRGQDIENQQAADRLQLAYDQLASQEKRESMAAQQKHDLAAATLALKGQQMDMLDAYRQNTLAQRGSELDFKQSRGEALDAYRQQRMEEQEKGLDLRRQLGESQSQARDAAQALKESQAEAKQGESKLRTVGSTLVQVQPDGSVKQIYPPPEAAQPTTPDEPNIGQKLWRSIFGGPSAAPSPAAGTTNSPAAAAAMLSPGTNAPASLTPEMKLERAKELRQAHPDWTKQQILDAVGQ